MPIDPSAQIAPTARVHPEASIGPQVIVGEFCVVEQDVTIGRACRLEPYVYVKRWTTLGEENEISAGTALGTDPLDKAFSGARSYLRIGNGNKIREHFTVSRGTQPESVTRIGDGNYVMTAGHIAHNCVIGNNTVIASGALVAGYVEVGDRAFLSGNVVVHQHSRVGTLAMVGGNCRVNLDLPPYLLYHGFDARPVGLNLVGLKRNGFTPQTIAALKEAYRLLYRKGWSREAALVRLEESFDPDVHTFARFVRESRRGIARPSAATTA